MLSGGLFNYQSKAKTNSIYKQCNDDGSGSGNDDNFSYLGECKKGPFHMFTQNFTNSYDNCV
jgi:hypothetical protein